MADLTDAELTRAQYTPEQLEQKIPDEVVVPYVPYIKSEYAGPTVVPDSAP